MKSKMFKQKRGVGQVVAWILLLGFAVSLATVIFFWATKNTETVTSKTINYVEGGMQCEQIGINFDTNSTCGSVNVKNTGYLTVAKISMRKISDEPTYTEPIDVKIAPGSTYAIPQNEVNKLGSLSGTTFEIVPIINVKGEFIGCDNKGVSKEC